MRATRFIALAALVGVSFSCNSALPEGTEPYLDDGVGFDDEFGSAVSLLSAAERRARAAQIRDAARANGMTQGWLLAGIADAETTMAHCHSELTWACRGPNSSDCGGGPVVAGAGDGPCSLRQGGLGMFQFDAGTFDDTLAREGSRILSVAGNVAAAVDFVVAMTIRSVYIEGVSNRDQAIAWMNGVRVGNAQWDPWIRTVTHYYNGCRPSASCFSSRYGRYRDHTSNVRSEMGAEFWEMGGGPGGADWQASFVSQTFPFARDPFELTGGEESAGVIELRNDGTGTWNPGEVFLGTTEPRDVMSPIAGSDWVAPNRAATVHAVTAPGGVGRFEFSVRGPSMTGDYPQYFNLVREGVSWFTSPRDDQLQIRVTVTSASCPEGTSARWSCDGDVRRRCLGTPEEETCEHGCLEDDAGAVCASPPRDDDMDGFLSGEDCDDTDPAVFPGADDPCGDGIDANCDGIDDCDPVGPDGGVTPTPDGGPDTGPDSRPSAGGCAVSATGGSDGPHGWLFLTGLTLWATRRNRRARAERA